MSYTLNQNQKNALKENCITQNLLKYSKEIFKGNWLNRLSAVLNSKKKNQENQKEMEKQFFEVIKKCKNIEDIKKHQKEFNISNKFIEEMKKFEKGLKKLEDIRGNNRNIKVQSYVNLFRFLEAYNQNNFSKMQKALHLYFSKDLKGALVEYKEHDTGNKAERLISCAENCLKAFSINTKNKDLIGLNKKVRKAKKFSDDFKKFSSDKGRIENIREYFNNVKEYINWYANTMEVLKSAKDKIQEIEKSLETVDVGKLTNLDVADKLCEYVNQFFDAAKITFLKGHREPVLITIAIRTRTHLQKMLEILKKEIENKEDKRRLKQKTDSVDPKLREKRR